MITVGSPSLISSGIRMKSTHKKNNDARAHILHIDLSSTFQENEMHYP